MQFLPDLENFRESIDAGLADGSLVEWRVDSVGRAWYRTAADEIRGIAPDSEITGDSFDDDDLIEAAELVADRCAGDVITVSHRQKALLQSLGLVDD
jgi:hypothetical protein